MNYEKNKRRLSSIQLLSKYGAKKSCQLIFHNLLKNTFGTNKSLNLNKLINKCEFPTFLK